MVKMKKLILFKCLAVALLVSWIVLMFVLSWFTEIPLWLIIVIGVLYYVPLQLLLSHLYRCPSCKCKISFLDHWIPYEHCPYCGKKFKDGM